MNPYESRSPGPADPAGIGLGLAFSGLRTAPPPPGWAARALRERKQAGTGTTGGSAEDGPAGAPSTAPECPRRPEAAPSARLAPEPGADGAGRARRGTGPAQALDEDAEPDWQVVIALRATASELITERREQWELEHRRTMAPEDRRLMGRSIIVRTVHEHADELARSGRALWPLALERRYAKAVEDAIFGYGRMQPVFDIPDAENIEIHGFDTVVAQFGDGRRRELAPVADSDEELVAAVRFLGENANPPRPFDDAHPTITVAVGDRFRLHAIGFGLADRPSVIIRQHLLTDVSLGRLAAGGLMPREVADLLRRAVLARLSIVISGDQGAGKTTLLRALVDAIPDTERFGTLETDYELLTHLQPRRRNMVALQATVGFGEVIDGRRIGEYTVADLIPEALRQNLARLVVGEVRGNEAGAMLQAMQSGAGALTTTHSHSAASTMDRLAARVAAGGVLRLDEAYRQIAYNIHLLVHVTLLDDSWRGGPRRRFIGEIRSLTGAVEGERPVTHLVYRAGRDGEPEVFDPGEELLAELAPFAGEGARP